MKVSNNIAKLNTVVITSYALYILIGLILYLLFNSYMNNSMIILALSVSLSLVSFKSSVYTNTVYKSAFGAGGLPRVHYENMIIEANPRYKWIIVGLIEKLRSNNISDAEIKELIVLMDKMKGAYASRNGAEYTWLVDITFELMGANQHRLYAVTKDLNLPSFFIKTFHKIYYDAYIK